MTTARPLARSSAGPGAFCYRGCMRSAFAALVLVSCVSGDTGLDGQLSVRSDADGEWSVAPDDCASGERQGFFGVDLVEDDDGGRAVRIVLDPIDGYHLLMNVPGKDYALVLSEADPCARFDLHVERTNTRINNIWEVRGHALVTCNLPGLEVDADLQFACW